MSGAIVDFDSAKNTHGRSDMSHDERVSELLWSCKSYSEVCEELATAEELAGSLRAECADLLDNLMPEMCAKACWCEVKDYLNCPDHRCGNYAFVESARALGV